MDTARIRTELEQKLAELIREEHGITVDLRASAERDFDDQAINREGEEVLEQRNVRGREEMERIREALGRIDRGTYGVCIRCGKKIGAARLKALPYTAHCISCA